MREVTELREVLPVLHSRRPGLTGEFNWNWGIVSRTLCTAISNGWNAWCHAVIGKQSMAGWCDATWCDDAKSYRHRTKVDYFPISLSWSILFLLNHSTSSTVTFFFPFIYYILWNSLSLPILILVTYSSSALAILLAQCLSSYNVITVVPSSTVFSLSLSLEINNRMNEWINK